MTTTLEDLKKRVLQISFDKKLSHIGSVLVALPIIYEIYSKKKYTAKDKNKDIFILSAGHSGLALYCILEAFEGQNAEELFDKHGVHPNRDIENGIYCSAGSLGHGLGIAVGVALADRKRDVYCLVTDGEMAEGSCWEALRIAGELELDNLHVHFNFNGYGAYGEVSSDRLEKQIKSFQINGLPHFHFHRTSMEGYPEYLQGLSAHYKTLNKEEYDEVIKVIEKSHE